MDKKLQDYGLYKAIEFCVRHDAERIESDKLKSEIAIGITMEAIIRKLWDKSGTRLPFQNFYETEYLIGVGDNLVQELGYITMSNYNIEVNLQTIKARMLELLPADIAKSASQYMSELISKKEKI